VIVISIGKKRYKGIYLWSDMTLRLFKKLSSISIPERYSSFVVADGDVDLSYKPSIDHYIEEISKVTDEDLNVVFPVFYKKVVQTLTDIPESVINELSIDRIEEMFEYYFKPFVITLLYSTPFVYFMGRYKLFEPEYLEYFRLGWHKYYLPEKVVMNGVEIPLAKEPIVTYSEATDQLKNMMKIGEGDADKLALVMAIYCRRKGEEYSEKKALERKELFMDVTMDRVWSVFFYIVRRQKLSSSNTRLFSDLPKGIRERVGQVRSLKQLDIVL
jgi:hypothetical protein